MMVRLRVAGLALFVLQAAHVLGQGQAIDPAVFPAITPSVDLQWHDCYGIFKCARLIVPAKVTKEAKPPRTKCKQNTVTLAIIKLPAAPGFTRKGAVHVALGGWSASSTNFLVKYGQGFQPLFEGYDLVGIDYRGFGYSTPAFTCFANEAERQEFFQNEPALLGHSHRALEDRRARAEKFAQGCKTHGGDVGKYIGTFANAVDHYYFMKVSGDTKMSFWGVSSGTHLGQTVAYLWPETVDKFFLDGPVPSELAYTITSAQPSQLKNADVALEAFFYTCLHSAQDQSGCAFRGNSTTVAELRTRYNAVDAAIKARPLAVPGAPGPFDWSALHRFLSTALHGPGWFAVLGGVLAEAEARAPLGWIPYALLNVVGAPPPPRFPAADENAVPEGNLAGPAIDEASHVRDNNNFRHYLDALLAAAPTVGPLFAEWRLVGQKWDIRPVNRYPGGFAPVDLSATGGKVLLHNNAGDPAVSDEASAAVAAKFRPSAVFRTAGAGHTLFSALSDCAFGVIYRFFNLDMLPDPGFVCSPLQTPPFGVELPLTF